MTAGTKRDQRSQKPLGTKQDHVLTHQEDDKTANIVAFKDQEKQQESSVAAKSFGGLPASPTAAFSPCPQPRLESRNRYCVYTMKLCPTRPSPPLTQTGLITFLLLEFGHMVVPKWS